MATTTLSYTGIPAIWVVPAGVTSVTVECWGAGASGGGESGADGGGGGGGGAYSVKVLAVTPEEEIDYYVGGGGGVVDIEDGIDGEDTWFGSITTGLAKGGSKGLAGFPASMQGDVACR